MVLLKMFCYRIQDGLAFRALLTASLLYKAAVPRQTSRGAQSLLSFQMPFFSVLHCFPPDTFASNLHF